MRCYNFCHCFHDIIKVQRSNVFLPWVSCFILKQRYMEKTSVTYVYLTIVKCKVKNIINHLQPFTNHLITSYIKVSHIGLCIGPQKVWPQWMHRWGNARLSKWSFSPLDVMDGTWGVALEGTTPDGPFCCYDGSFLDDALNVLCCNTLCVSCDSVVFVLSRRSSKWGVFGGGVRCILRRRWPYQ